MISKMLQVRFLSQHAQCKNSKITQPVK